MTAPIEVVSECDGIDRTLDAQNQAVVGVTSSIQRDRELDHRFFSVGVTLVPYILEGSPHTNPPDL